MTEATPTARRTAILAACADMIRACGLTLAELADVMGVPLQAPSPIALPSPGRVAGADLTERMQQALQCCSSPDGASLSDIELLMGVAMQTAWTYLNTLNGAGLVVRVKASGVRGTRFFADAAHAQAWFDSHAKAPAATPVARPAAPPAPFPEPAPAAAPAVATLTPAEVKTAKIHAGRIAAAKKAPQPTVSRTERVKKGKDNITFSPPKVPTDIAKPKGEAILTEKTVQTRDTTVRPTAKWQTQDLQPDPRYPSFSSMRPGTDPRTGKAWEGRA